MQLLCNKFRRKLGDEDVTHSPRQQSCILDRSLRKQLGSNQGESSTVQQSSPHTSRLQKGIRSNRKDSSLVDDKSQPAKSVFRVSRVSRAFAAATACSPIRKFRSCVFQPRQWRQHVAWGKSPRKPKTRMMRSPERQRYQAFRSGTRQEFRGAYTMKRKS